MKHTKNMDFYPFLRINNKISMFSPYQLRKNGLQFRQYSKYDIIVEQQKLQKIEDNRKNFTNVRLKRLAEKHKIIIKKNIEFYCRMINQQILEK